MHQQQAHMTLRMYRGASCIAERSFRRRHRGHQGRRIDVEDGYAHVAYIFEGDVFGEVALVLKQVRTQAVRSKVFSEMYSLAANDFQAVARDFPSFGKAAETIAKRRAFSLATDSNGNNGGKQGRAGDKGITIARPRPNGRSFFLPRTSCRTHECD